MMELKRFVTEEDGMAVVEVILIIVVLIALVVIFKNRITKVVNSIFKSIDNKTSDFIK